MYPSKRKRRLVAGRRESLRTNLWLLPTVLVAASALLFAATYGIDRLAADGTIALPDWISTGSADAARQVLVGIAAAVITVAGVVFSITILTLQLASQQFGPRMLRNFIRDGGTQITLGVFVSTFTFAVLALGSVGSGTGSTFVPHFTVVVALGLTLADLGVLIYFIHHVAASIQLTAVVSAIAQDFAAMAAPLQDEAERNATALRTGPGAEELISRLSEEGTIVAAHRSGFLQAVGHDRLVAIAASSDATIRLIHRPGHFVVESLPMALVLPRSAASDVRLALERAHLIGANRTLAQDPGFAMDQLVEIALRALSPAVNDTFTALNCIDWLGASLCRVTARQLPDGIYRDKTGRIRLIDSVISYERLVKGAFDKLRQAGEAMPAVLIRQLENLQKIMQVAERDVQHRPLLRHAELLLRASERSVLEESDRQDVRAAYDAVIDYGTRRRV